ncbi:MAG: 30S ribosomal protein S16 [bacterium]|nr:30S ribosomal protein S16 [bacterium]
MLTIRLQRVGKKKQPVFRIVLAEKHRAAKKLAVEILGHYNPRSKEFVIKDEGRLKYWIEKHTETSPTVHNLFVTKGIVPGKKVQAWRPKVKEKAEQVAPASPKVEAKTETPAQAAAQISNS